MPEWNALTRYLDDKAIEIDCSFENDGTDTGLPRALARIQAEAEEAVGGVRVLAGGGPRDGAAGHPGLPDESHAAEGARAAAGAGRGQADRARRGARRGAARLGADGARAAAAPEARRRRLRQRRHFRQRRSHSAVSYTHLTLPTSDLV